MVPTRRFVEAKLALLDEEPALAAAAVDQTWNRIHCALGARRRAPRTMRWLAAAAASLLLFLAPWPPVMVWGQGVWSWLVLGRTESIQLDLTRTSAILLLPNVFPLSPREETQRWRAESVTAATALAGYPVRTLSGPLVTGSPVLDVVEPPAMRRRIEVSRLSAELEQLGRTLPPVPPGLDGAEVAISPQGRAVWSRYGECPAIVGPWTACALLVQSRPMVLGLPSGISLADFTRFSLELAGLPAHDATRLTAWAGGQPTLFLPLEAKAVIRRVRVRGTSGVLAVYERSTEESAFTLDWQEAGFDFRLYGREPQDAIALAESLQ